MTLPAHGENDPPRGSLPRPVEDAASIIHIEVWGEPYEAGKGPMHHAGGGYWHDELLRRADRWERLAGAARVCAEVLPRD